MSQFLVGSVTLSDWGVFEFGVSDGLAVSARPFPNVRALLFCPCFSFSTHLFYQLFFSLRGIEGESVHSLHKGLCPPHVTTVHIARPAWKDSRCRGGKRKRVFGHPAALLVSMPCLTFHKALCPDSPQVGGSCLLRTALKS